MYNIKKEQKTANNLASEFRKQAKLVRKEIKNINYDDEFDKLSLEHQKNIASDIINMYIVKA